MVLEASLTSHFHQAQAWAPTAMPGRWGGAKMPVPGQHIILGGKVYVYKRSITSLWQYQPILRARTGASAESKAHATGDRQRGHGGAHGSFSCSASMHRIMPHEL